MESVFSMPHLRHPTRVTLDVVMEDFWTRPSGVYGKPVWLRPGVLQLVYDDDNDQLKRISGPTVPGGHAVFTRTASVYSMCEITDADLDVASASAATAALRHQVAAFTQRVGSVYLVEANILGFATHGSDLQEPCVLSSSIRWALSDYQDRFGCPPSQIVLHLDVNGSLALGDLAGAKKMEDMARRMADDTLLRHEKEQVALTEAQEHTLRDATKSDDTALQQDCCFSASYSSRDFVRSLILCQVRQACFRWLRVAPESFSPTSHARLSCARARSPWLRSERSTRSAAKRHSPMPSIEPSVTFHRPFL